jgi:DNA-directed RNA polymerase specialized sigma24 family protein
MTFEEMAVVLGSPMNTVKSQYHRALRALHKVITRGNYGAISD